MDKKIVNEIAATGATRAQLYPKTDESKFPIRLDLVFNNPEGLRRLAETYGEGATKYGDNNWKKGFPESVMLSHALEHIRLHMERDTSEDHLAHATWNLYTLMWFQTHKPELMDLTYTSPKLACRSFESQASDLNRCICDSPIEDHK